MEISEVRTQLDLLNFICEWDTNKDGKLDHDEAPELNPELSVAEGGYDQDDNDMLSPYEFINACPTLIENQGEDFSGFRDGLLKIEQGSARLTFLVEAGDVDPRTREVEIHGVKFKINTRVYFNKDFTLSAAHLPSNTSINIGGIRLRGDAEAATGDVRFKEISSGGLMAVGILNGPYTASDGTKFKAGEEIAYIVKSDGSIQVVAGTLAKPSTTIRGIALPKGSKIVLGTPIPNTPPVADDHLWSATLPEGSSVPVRIKGQEVQVRGTVNFYDIRVTHVTLAANWSSPLGIVLVAGDEIWLDENEQLRQVKLSAPTPVGRTRFNPGTVLHVLDGKIHHVNTTGETRIGNLTLPAGSSISYAFEDGNLHLPNGSVPSYQSGDHYAVAVGAYVDASATVAAGGVSGVADGVTGTGGVAAATTAGVAPATYRMGNEEIKLKGGGALYYFYPNGQLQGGYLAEDATINGVKYKGGTSITFYSDGRVEWGTLAAPQPPAGQAAQTPAPAAQPPAGVLFYVNGKIVRFQPGTFISYHPDGSVASGILAADTTIIVSIKGTPTLITFKAGTKISFDNDGKVTQGTLSQGFTVDDRVCETYTVPGHGGGPFAMPASTHESCRGGITRFYAGEVVDFDENGNLRYPRR